MAKKNQIVDSLQDVINCINDGIKPPVDIKAEAKKVRAHFEGDRSVVSPRNFPIPTLEMEREWAEVSKTMVHINRVKGVARVWKGLLNGNVTRKIHECPNKDIISANVDNYEFHDAVGAWKQNAILYGTSVAVPVYDESTKKCNIWLPLPENTVIITNPMNVYDTLAVIEVIGDTYQFISKWGEGFISKELSKVSARNYSYLPVAIGYGSSRLHERNPYGLGYCREAVEFSTMETHTAFNIALLARQQTRDILAITGPLEKISQHKHNEDVQIGANPDGTLILPDGFEAEFLKPNPLITQAIEVQSNYARLFCSVTGLPIDIIAPDQVQNPSNESARIRSASLNAMAQDIVPRWISYETKLILAMAYMVEYFKTGGAAISPADIEKRSNIEIRNNYCIIPVSPNERTQDNIALVAAGFKRPEDAIRESNDHLTEAQIQELAAAYTERLRNEGAKAIEQAALKESKGALTDNQISKKENLS